MYHTHTVARWATADQGGRGRAEGQRYRGTTRDGSTPLSIHACHVDMDGWMDGHLCIWHLEFNESPDARWPSIHPSMHPDNFTGTRERMFLRRRRQGLRGQLADGGGWAVGREWRVTRAGVVGPTRVVDPSMQGASPPSCGARGHRSLFAARGRRPNQLSAQEGRLSIAHKHYLNKRLPLPNLAIPKVGSPGCMQCPR